MITLRRQAPLGSSKHDRAASDPVLAGQGASSATAARISAVCSCVHSSPTSAASVPARAQLATSDGVRAAPALVGRYTAAALAREAGVDEAVVEDLVRSGVLRATPAGHFDAWARDVVVLAGALGEHGIDARHLRMFRAAADRQADLVDQVVAPWRGHHAASSRARAGTLAAEVGELCTQLHTALMRAAVAELAP
jgi:hypothetical protein